jgi:hypothetical protein
LNDHVFGSDFAEPCQRKSVSMKKAVELTFMPIKAGPLRYACAMAVVSGERVAE